MTVATNETDKTGENVVQNALNETGFGKFNLKLLAVCAMTCVNEGLLLGNIGLIIPSAACDFEMSTLAKGRLAMMPIFGMMFGPYCWAAVAEIKGRRIGLIAALILHAVGDFTASLVSNYWGLLIGKFVVGFGFSGLILVFTYLGEFQPSKHRDRLLAWLELPFVCGLVIVAALGWAIIPQTFSYEIPMIGFFFKSWNLYLLSCSLLAPLLALWLAFLPETPKYLAETGQHTKLLNLLQDIYQSNTGNPREKYLEKLKSLKDTDINELIAKAQERSIPIHKTARQMVNQYFEQTLELVRPPYFKTTMLTVISSYAITTPYFTLTFWLPEIFQRYSVFEDQFPGKSATVCIVSRELYSVNVTQNVEVDYSNCINVLDETVYIHNMILATACIPVAFWLPLFVDKFGYKLHLVFTTLLSAAVVYSMFLVKTSTQNLIVACLFEALAAISITILFCIVVELYPTHLRVIASAFTSFVGRVGAFIGMSTVGYLIDNYCVSLIAFIGAHLVVAGITAIFMPIKKSHKGLSKSEEPVKQPEITIYKL